jgi:hypothetical protein
MLEIKKNKDTLEADNKKIVSDTAETIIGG